MLKLWKKACGNIAQWLEPHWRIAQGMGEFSSPNTNYQITGGGGFWMGNFP
jgi:hypothetical protein